MRRARTRSRLHRETTVQANQCDADNDCTWADWQVPNPRFSVGVNEGPQQVWGSEFDPGAAVTLTVNTVAKGVVATVSSDPEDAGNFSFDPFAAAGVTLSAGDVVVVSDGTNTKELTVSTALSITLIDEDNDEVSGVATADAWVNVHIHNACGVGTQADASTGAWLVAFTPESGCEYDIGPGTNGQVEEYDDDSDSTVLQWSIAEDPWFSVTPDAGSIYDPGDRVYGWAFAPDT